MTVLTQQLQTVFGERMALQQPLKPLTSLKIGGPVDIIVFPENREEVITTIDHCRQQQTPFRIIGGGTNILVADKGYRGVVIYTAKHMNRCFVDTKLQETTDENNSEQNVYVYSDAGTRMSRVLSLTLKEGLAGFEFAAGIPGTFGGALWMNAGTRGGAIADVFHAMDVIETDGKLKTLTTGDVNFDYRASNLKPGTTIIGGYVCLQRGDATAIAASVEQIKGFRQGQPLTWPSAGSVFKNPPGDYAARLIESCGLKGSRSGGAMISDSHANFIINTGDATAQDVLALIDKIKQQVRRQCGILLETEVEMLC